MRKFALSAFVVLTFLFYAAHKRFGNEASSVAAPNNLSVLDQPSLPTQPGNKLSGTSSGNSGNRASNTTRSTPMPQQTGSQYKDGQYTGDSADAYYGNIQVQVTISGGKIADVVFLDYPHDRRTSVEINSQAMPYLKQEAIAAQSANVDIVSGATDTSRAFIQSLQSALDKAKS